jgi:hypothetical protein
VVVALYYRAVVDDDASLLKEIMTAGLDEASLPELQKQLKDYLAGTNSTLGVPSDYGVRVPQSRHGGAGEIDMSALDALLKDDEDDFKDGATAIDDIVDEDATATADLDAAAEGQVGDASRSVKSVDDEITVDNAAEWSRILKEYVKQPTTKLEQERDRIFSKLEYASWKDARTENELHTFRRQRYVCAYMCRYYVFSSPFFLHST